MEDRIKLVRVTLGAGCSQPQPGCAGCAHPIDHREVAELERIDAPLLVEHRVAVEAGGDDVVGGGPGQQVAGDLTDGELVERHVGVQAADHPVAIRPDLTVAVLLIPVGVGVPGQVEPPPRPPFAIPRAGNESLDEFFIRVGRGIREECVQVCRRWRQPDEIEMDATAERGPIGLGAGREPFLFEPRQHKPVDVILRPVGVGRDRHGWPDGLHERPVGPVVGPGGDPVGEDPLLAVGEHDLRMRRGHDKIGVGARDPGDEFAVVWVAGHDGPRAAVEFADGLLSQVEPQARLTPALIGPMALETAVGKNRPDLAGEVRPGRPACGGCQQKTTGGDTGGEVGQAGLHGSRSLPSSFNAAAAPIPGSTALQS